MKKVLIYARVSTSHHDQKPEVQINELRRYCEARKWNITNEIIDHGFSGGTTVRPGLKELLKLARTRRVDSIIVLKLDRLFRSVKHLITILEEFHTLGIQFVAIEDNVDWSTASGKFFIQILASFAELEKNLVRERTLLGLENAKRRGKTLGRPRSQAYGEILRLREAGLSYGAISKQLGINRGVIFRAVTASTKKVG